MSRTFIQVGKHRNLNDNAGTPLNLYIQVHQRRVSWFPHIHYEAKFAIDVSGQQSLPVSSATWDDIQWLDAYKDVANYREADVGIFGSLISGSHSQARLKILWDKFDVENNGGAALWEGSALRHFHRLTRPTEIDSGGKNGAKGNDTIGEGAL